MEKAIFFEVQGQRIAGMLHLPVGRGKVPAVVLCHGLTGQRMEAHFLFVKMARELVRRGMGAVRFDFRGSGESKGRFRDMTIATEVEDAVAAMKLARRQKRVDGERVGLLGLSMGGCVAALAGNVVEPRSLALWSAVAHPGELFGSVLGAEARRELLRERVVTHGAHELGRKFFEVALQSHPLDAVSECDYPLLVVHCTGDESVPVSHARDFLAAARKKGRRTKLKVIRGGDHTFNEVKTEKWIISLTAGWFKETL